MRFRFGLPKLPTTPTTPERLNALCDGVFAIALTVLVFDLKLPSVAQGGKPQELKAYLLFLVPTIKAYVISFFVVASFWVQHQRRFQFVRVIDRRVVSLMLVHLLLVSSLPFPTGLWGLYNKDNLAQELYIGWVGLTLLSDGLVWWAVTRVTGSLDPVVTPTIQRDLGVMAFGLALTSCAGAVANHLGGDSGMTATLVVGFVAVFGARLVNAKWPVARPVVAMSPPSGP